MSDGHQAIQQTRRRVTPIRIHLNKVQSTFIVLDLKQGQRMKKKEPCGTKLQFSQNLT